METNTNQIPHPALQQDRFRILVFMFAYLTWIESIYIKGNGKSCIQKKNWQHLQNLKTYKYGTLSN